MSDAEKVTSLIQIARTSLPHAERVAAQKLLNYDGEIYPRDGCAITLSVLLQEAGIDVEDTFQAIALGRVLEKRGWQVIPVGQQQAGDVGSTCGQVPVHGQDHIYLVLQALNQDEMVIADNQAQSPHFRWASGKGGKTPTTHFLRAGGAVDEEWQSSPGSWFSQYRGKYTWEDPNDAPGSNALGVPDSKQGIALPSRHTLGRYFIVVAPNGVELKLRQTDIGPSPSTGRKIDIASAAAEQFGYSPEDFPTGGIFKWRAA